MSKNQSPSQDDSSRSRSRGRLSTTLAALSAKIANTLNSPSEDGNPQAGSPKGPIPGAGFTRWGVQRSSSKGREEDQSTLSEAGDRSLSRGRDGFYSSGRGGAGNIRQASASRDARPDTGPDDFSSPRGREPRPVLPTDASGTHAFSTGRGGAGNMRSPSRDMRTGTGSVVGAVEDQLIRSHIAAEQDAVHSTGRGGIGNMTGGSRSRSRARDSTSNAPTSGTHTPLHSTGRGGAGNILSGHTPSVAEADEIDVIAHLPRHSDDVHSTGRGGAANITHAHAPPVEHTHHHHKHGEYESTGRGGAGNIVQT